VQEISAKWDNQLSREFTRVLRDMGMGQSWRQALLGLSERTGVQGIISSSRRSSRRWRLITAC
jgi:tight adherence protein C